MTPDQLAELDALEAKATSGPWTEGDERLTSNYANNVVFTLALRNAYPALRAQLAAYQAELPEAPDLKALTVTATRDAAFETRLKAALEITNYIDSLRATIAGLKVENERLKESVASSMAETSRISVCYDAMEDRADLAESTVAELRAKVEVKAGEQNAMAAAIAESDGRIYGLSTAPTEAAAMVELLLADQIPAVSHRKEAAALIARQADELEAVRKDAERYRKLKDNWPNGAICGVWTEEAIDNNLLTRSEGGGA